MSEEIITKLTEIDAPYGRKIALESVEHFSDMRMLRIRIREGSRFTVLDIDKDTAMLISAAMTAWAGEKLH